MMYFYNVQIKCNIPANDAMIRDSKANAIKFQFCLLGIVFDYHDAHKEAFQVFQVSKLIFDKCSWELDDYTDSKRPTLQVTFEGEIGSKNEHLDVEPIKPALINMVSETVQATDIQIVIADSYHRTNTINRHFISDISDLVGEKLKSLDNTDIEDEDMDIFEYMECEEDEEPEALTDIPLEKETTVAMASVENAEEKLNNMIGLKEVKNVIKELVAAARVRKMREEIGLPVLDSSMHMIYTGNPGTAKTTVARLLAGILNKYGIIKENKFIECGRSSLVGEFVGHTAPKVKAKFDDAKGGILFIDEAYSLVGEGKDFGDEAITTIVQEMENHRNDVIVIFAGYPDRMKAFLDQNDGLKSRIKYHLEFPDYDENELLDILKLMVSDNGYLIDEETGEKCLGIFKQAKAIHNFGNGRFVRNILEQAVTQQSLRILAKAGKKPVSKKQLMQLKAEDFKQTLVPNKEVKRPTRIGFNLIGVSKYSKAE